MSAEIITLIWLITGVSLIGAELVLPGLVSIFMGIAAVLVAGLRFVGLLDSMPASLITWMVLSVVSVLAFRKVAKKWLPSETTDENFDEDRDFLGRVVEVTDEISEHHKDGRIRFQGTSWTATCTDGVIKKGEKARIIYRDNLVWVVEPYKVGMGELPPATTEAVPVLSDDERALVEAEQREAEKSPTAKDSVA